MDQKTVILKVGNFDVATFAEGEHEWVMIAAADGHWRVCYRDDSAMYGLILTIVGDGELHSLMHYFVNMLFLLSSDIPDPTFVKDFYIAFEGKVDRMIAAHKAANPEEEEETEQMAQLSLLQSQLTDLIIAANGNAQEEA